MQLTPIRIDDYHVSCLLGDGGQANVYLGKKQLKLYAVKVYLNKPSRMNTYLNEVKLLEKVNFINIINMIEHKPQAIIQYPNNSTEASPIVVLEFADHGELFNLVSKTGRLEQIVCRTLFKQLIAAIKYLHEVNVAHRDIKLENILFDDHFNLKLSDFGLAKTTEEQVHLQVLHSNVGTKAYKAPEIGQQDYDGLKVDLFAAAVTLFVMFTRAMPFSSTSKSDGTYNLIRNNKIQIFWSQLENRRPKGFYSPSFKEMITALFCSIPEKRPSLEELENCDWMKESILSNEELKVKLAERYNKMCEKDETMKKIKKEQLDLLKMKLEQKWEGSEERLNESSFDRDYFDLKIDFQDLPIRNVHGVVYSKVSPSLLIYYLRSYLKGQLESGNSFMNDYHLDIRPLKYQLNVKENRNQVQLHCQFEVAKQSIVNLEIQGLLLREQGSESIGIKWKGVQGNEIWMGAIISEMINQQEYL